VVVRDPARTEQRLELRLADEVPTHLVLEVGGPVQLDGALEAGFFQVEAALGAKVDVPTPKGTISLRIPPGTSSGKRLRAKGLGIAPKGTDPGDLFAEVEIMIPKELDQESLDLIKRLDEHINRHAAQNPRRDLRW
jgi:DnaJ-class molecular chaperone